MNDTGVNVPGICGKKVKDCRHHAIRRLGGANYQYGMGSYPPVLPVSRGFTGHGLACGPYYTDAQVLAFQAEEAKEMTHSLAMFVP